MYVYHKEDKLLSDATILYAMRVHHKSMIACEISQIFPFIADTSHFLLCSMFAMSSHFIYLLLRVCDDLYILQYRRYHHFQPSAMHSKLSKNHVTNVPP